ncbi:MAG: hypothetical protein H6739_11720 [Alphaproteobacteria bacterium]|nr:hypothetical protein [Alphaproteobacteria bacterium]
MGSCLHRFDRFLLRGEGHEERWLVRVTRPAAPNPDGAACDFAWALADARAECLLRSALAEVGWTATWRREAYYVPSPDRDDPSPLSALHGQPHLRILCGQEVDRYGRAAMWTAPSQAAFRDWLDEHETDDDLIRLAWPARALEVRFITEADYALHEEPLFVARDVLWVVDRYHQTGLDGLAPLTRPRRPCPELSREAFDGAALALVLRSLVALDAEGEERDAAFQLSWLAELAGGDVHLWPRVEALIARMDSSPDDGDGALVWALGYALHRLGDPDAAERRLLEGPGARALRNVIAEELWDMERVAAGDWEE